VSAEERQRSQIVQAFATNPSKAVLVYRPAWQGAVAAKQPYSLANLSIAGALMSADPENYRSYYGYVMGAVNLQDEDVASAAMDALAHARGNESIDVLVRHSSDDRDYVASSSMTALSFRMATSKFDPGLSEDFKYLESKLPALCRNHFSESLKHYCEQPD